MNHNKNSSLDEHLSMWEKASTSRSTLRSARSIEPPWDPLAARLRELLQASNKTIYQLSADTGIDGTYIWRIVRGERVEISREVLLLLSISLVLDKTQSDKVVEMANQLLDAGGYKVLRGKS